MISSKNLEELGVIHACRQSDPSHQIFKKTFATSRFGENGGAVCSCGSRGGEIRNVRCLPGILYSLHVLHCLLTLKFAARQA